MLKIIQTDLGGTPISLDLWAGFGGASTSVSSCRDIVYLPARMFCFFPPGCSLSSRRDALYLPSGMFCIFPPGCSVSSLRDAMYLTAGMSCRGWASGWSPTNALVSLPPSTQDNLSAILLRSPGSNSSIDGARLVEYRFFFFVVRVAAGTRRHPQNGLLGPSPYCALPPSLTQPFLRPWCG